MSRRRKQIVGSEGESKPVVRAPEATVEPERASPTFGKLMPEKRRPAILIGATVAFLLRCGFLLWMAFAT